MKRSTITKTACIRYLKSLDGIGRGTLRPLALCTTVMLAYPAHASVVSVTGGFTSFSGTVGSGQFETTINGNVVCPDAGCGTTVGTTSFNFPSPAATVDFSDSQFGVPSTPNSVAFKAAAPQDVALGQEFLLGTFTYTNGVWFDNPTFGFTLTSVSSDPAFNGHSFSDSLIVTITPNSTSNTPAQNADFISFAGRQDLGSLRVYELSDSSTGGNSGTIDFYGKIDSLIPTRFANPTGAGFFDPSVDLQPSAVPLPAAAWLLFSGLGILSIIGRRRVVRGASAAQ